MKSTWIVIALLIVFACSKDDPSGISDEEKSILDYLETNSLTYSKATGVYQYVIIENPGGSADGNVLSIYYELTDLLSGDVIGSHQIGDGDPIKLLHDASSVFPVGLDKGLTGMREGETYGLILPANLGYGDYPSSSVPEDAILHFVVEVVSRETLAEIAASEDLDINNYITINDLNNTVAHPVDPVVALTNGVYYKRMTAGDGIVPSTGDSITVSYTGTLLDGASFDSFDGFKYKFASGGVIDGFDLGAKEMEQGEEALIIIPSAEAYGGSVRVIPDDAKTDLINLFAIPEYAGKVGPFEVLVFDVTLQTVH